MIPAIWDVEGFIHFRTQQEGIMVPHGDSRIRIVLHDDHSWDMILTNDGASFSMILRGDRHTRASTTIIQMLSWIFSMPSA